MFTAEQALAAQRAQMETLLGLGAEVFEGVEKLTQLNLRTARETLGELSATTKSALAARDGSDLLALVAGLAQPATDKAIAYGREVYQIAAATNTELARLAEYTASKAQEKFLAAIDGPAGGSPIGGDPGLAFVKSAVTAANDAFDSLQQAARQAIGASDSRVERAASTALTALPLRKPRRSA